MPDRLVIDASVVAKWFLSDEADKDAADKLLLLLLSDEIEMSAPRVLLNETGAGNAMSVVHSRSQILSGGPHRLPGAPGGRPLFVQPGISG